MYSSLLFGTPISFLFYLSTPIGRGVVVVVVVVVDATGLVILLLLLTFVANTFLWFISWYFFGIYAFVLSFLICRPFLDNQFAQAIYFFKAWYFVVSSFQIISGYPHRVLGYYWGKSPNLISGTILQVWASAQCGDRSHIVCRIIVFMYLDMYWILYATAL